MNPSTICPDEQESTVSIEPPKPRMPDWVRCRRWRERKTGFSDPLLVEMGMSALPDAPPKPPKPPKPLQQPPETGSAAWAASLSCGAPGSDFS